MVTPPLFYILLALRDGERHGYEILKDVQAGSLGKMRLGPATLYTSLKRLLDAGFVQEVAGPRGSDSRRRYYRLTAFGRRVFSAEITRLEDIVREAKLRLRGARPKEAL